MKDHLIRSVRFNRTESPSHINEGKGWTEETSKNWLHAHDLYSDHVKVEPDSFRYKQTDEKFDDIETTDVGMPTGVMVSKGRPPKEEHNCQPVDGSTIKGKELSGFLEVAIPPDAAKRRFVLRKMAARAETSLTTVHMLLAGKLNCPTKKTLEKFAECLDVPVERLIAAAKRDGCHYPD